MNLSGPGNHDAGGRAASSGRRGPSHPIIFALSIVVAPALWVAFVATSNPHELLVGVLTSAATVAFTVVVCRADGTSLAFRPRDVVQLWRIPWQFCSGFWEIVVVLTKDLLGISRAQNAFRVCGFDSSLHDPVRLARTVLAVASTTNAPNFIVIGIDPAQSRMLFHQIHRTSVSGTARALGAKA